VGVFCGDEETLRALGEKFNKRSLLLASSREEALGNGSEGGGRKRRWTARAEAESGYGGGQKKKTVDKAWANGINRKKTRVLQKRGGRRI